MITRRIVAVATIILLVGGCAARPAADTAAAAVQSPPSWVLDLSPPPGAQWTMDRRVEITFNVSPAQSVRLLIDGTDVTDDALLGDGQLTYDPQQAPRTVPLGSGEHTASIERVRTGEGSGQDTVLDTFTWTFEIP